jgi:hypothetical protein
MSLKITLMKKLFCQLAISEQIKAIFKVFNPNTSRNAKTRTANNSDNVQKHDCSLK